MADFTRRDLLAGGVALSALAAAPATGQTAAPAPAAGPTPSLRGKSVLITGASSGFGHAGALLYARAGAKVIASMRNLPRAEAQTLERTARDERLDLHVVQIDVTSPRSIEGGVAAAQRIAGGGLDVLVNNAGIGISGPIEFSDDEAFESMFETNVHGYLRMARAVLPGMRQRGRGGVIFNVSSQLGRMIMPNIGLYSSTKFAVEAMMEQLAYELAPRGIEVVIIQPGGYPTRIWESGRGYTEALLGRVEDERKAGYPELMRNAVRNSGGTTDVNDVPRAIAEIMAMPAGSRPLRRAVHPGPRPQEVINQASATLQRTVLGRGPYAAWAEEVLG